MGWRLGETQSLFQMIDFHVLLVSPLTIEYDD